MYNLKPEEIAEQFTSLACDGFGSDHKTFVLAISNEHRTKQQAAISLMLRTIVEVSKCATDPRNEAAVSQCKKIVEVLGEDCYKMPFI